MSYLNDSFNQEDLFENYDSRYFQKYISEELEDEGTFYNKINEEDLNNEEEKSTENTDKIYEKVFPMNKPKENENKILSPMEIEDENNQSQVEETLYFKPNSETQTEIIISEKLIPQEIPETKNQIIENKIANELNQSNDNNNNPGNKNENKEFLEIKKKQDYNSDKIRKRVRIVSLKAIRYFINEKIKYFYNNNIGKGVLEMQFKEIDKTNLSHSKVDFDKQFLTLKLKDIFSWDISGKITNFLKEHNKKLLTDLLNAQPGNQFFTQFFEQTFSECLDQIKERKENESMSCKFIFENFCDKNEINDEEFYKNFEFVLLNYQELIGNKVPRKPRKKIDKK